MWEEDRTKMVEMQSEYNTEKRGSEEELVDKVRKKNQRVRET